MKRLLAAAVVGATCALSTGSAFATITAKSYVSDDLVALWDAKENSGYGVFNADATTWTDLSGKAFAISKSNGATFANDMFNVTREKGQGRAAGSPTLTDTDLFKAYNDGTFTVEIAYNQTAETTTGGPYNTKAVSMMMVGHLNVYVGLVNDNAAGFSSAGYNAITLPRLTTSVDTTMGQHTFSCRQDGANWKVDFDGAKTATGSNAGATGGLASSYGFYINQNYYENQGLNGGYHAIRFYKRPLTDDEVAVNRAVDQIRYFGADPASYTLPTGWRFTTGGDVTLEHEATIAPKGGAGGRVSVDGGEWADSASVWIEQGVGVTVAVKAMADEGYVFQGWSGNVEGEDLTLAETTLTVKGAVFAVFRKTDGSDPRTYSLVGTTGDWDDPTAWMDEFGFKGVPQIGDSAVVAAGKTLSIVGETAELASMTVAGTVTMTSWTNCLKSTDITVPNGGVITCGPPSRTQEGLSRVWISCENLTVAAGGKIDVALKGYAGKSNSVGAGPGAANYVEMTAPSHGGFGAISQVSSKKVKGKLPYDDLTAPTQPGSSGYMSPWQVSATRLSHGGGAVLVEATGAVTVNGSVLAYGADSDRSGQDESYYNQTGSGGSIFITCRAFAGSGTLDARGGNGEWVSVANYNRGLPAGGGCIAIHYDAEAQKSASVAGMTITADCGRCKGNGMTSSNVDDRDDPYGWHADIGTLHFTDDQIVRALIGKGLTGQIHGFDAFVWDGDLDFTSGRVRFAAEGVQVTVNGNLTLGGSDSRLEIGGCLATNGAHHAVVWAGERACGLTVTGDLTLGGKSRLDVRSAATETNDGIGATVEVTGTMTVSNGCRVCAWSDIFTLGSPKFAVGGLDLQEGSLFTADARGGSGNGMGATAHGPGVGTYGSGSGHGGVGGKGGTTPRLAGGPAYDSATLPSIPGSGGSHYGGEITGNGGGRIYVTAPGGTITVAGTVTACGEDGSLFDAAKSGSGGSGGAILLEAYRFVCGATGMLVADGGSSLPGTNLRNGAGAGGRIAVWCGVPGDPATRSSHSLISEVPFGTDYAEFFSWMGEEPSVAGGTSPNEDSNAEPGTVRYCYAKPKTGLLMLVR